MFLNTCNKKVVSIENILSSLKSDKNEIENILKDLNKEGLLYSSQNFEENVTIINTEDLH